MRKSVFLLDLAEPGQYEEVCLLAGLGRVRTVQGSLSSWWTWQRQDSTRTSVFLLDLVRQDSMSKYLVTGLGGARTV